MFEPIEPTTEPSIPEDGHPAGVDSSTGDRKLLRPHRRGGKDRFEFLLKQTESISAKNVNESRTRGDVTKEVFRFETTPAYIQNGEMRDYQLRGLNWMISLYENNINGILADEMGLGKTLQTISLLGYLKHFKSLSGPFIVIVPKSTLQNWINEFTKWCPTLATFCLIGDAKTRSRIIHDVMAAGKWDVCVTSYEMCLCEQAALQKIDWRYMVIDEAHRIKNEKTKLATVLREFKTANRLLLTGTPLQNNLHELWALLNFLLPDVFDSSEDFDEWFNTNTCLGSDALMKRLHTVLAPFLLRRVKSDVESSLKAKNEINIFVGLSPMQHDLYKRILKKNLVILGTKMRVEFVLMHLRKCTNHPYLFEGVEPGPPYTTDTHIILNSGKLLILDKLLAKLKAQGSRVLIFSQMKAMLDILEDYCEWRNYEYCRLDGDTKHEYRDSQIQVFNKENSTKFIFMLTTRAGGVGINLATADVVIIYDSDWNPQMDLQAMDRAHRIGQQKQVRVFRLITENTVEEKIAECAEIKMRLDKLVLQKDCSELKLNRDQMRNIIRFGADSILAAQDSPTLNDEDIDTILERGLTKTIEQRSKLDQMAKESLRSLILDAHSHTTDATGGAGKSLYQFDGTDYGMKKLLEDHPQEDILETSLRQRRTARVSRSSSDQSVFHDFQFMPPRLIELLTKEREQGATTPLTDKEQLEKHELLQTAFPTWTKKDFSQFIQALREYARDDLPNIVQSVDNKTPEEVRAYYEVFWAQIHQVRNYTQIIKSFDRRSIKVAREEACEKLLRSLDGDVAIVNDRSVHHLTASPKFIRRGKLLDFQLEGLNWMISRFENGLNVLLADEMGLGKTLQAIALMGYYKNVMKIVEPYILIVPDTLTKQWKDEINRWCPSLRTMSIFNDTNNVDLENLRRTAGNNWDVCLTTLRVLNTKVGSVLTKINWYLMIIDEVHILKYNGHKFMRLFSKMLAGQRLLLSGAPMQRSFYELWIIIDLLLPNLFPTESKLKVWLNENNNFTSDKEMSDYLQTMTKAMVLRRTKLDVAEELMPKEDIILPVTLTNVQQELYVKAVQKHCTGLKDVNDMTKTSLQSKFDALFNIIDHPFLVEDYDSRYISRIVPSAGKIGQLDELLPALKKEGSRVLISTQSYKVLDILQHYCQWRNFKTTNLQEHTDDPYQAVCKLNSPNDKTFVVLFHARSDCIWGMNLPTVDVVIFYDANWNPFVNMQIVDRVHRIGQTKPVRVYHLVTKGTIEEDYVERVNSAQARSYNYQINKTEMWKILSNAGAELDGSLEATEEADLVGGKRKRRVSLALNPAKRMK